MSPPQGFSIVLLLSQVGAKTPDEHVESMNNLMETEFDKESDDDEVDVDEEMDIDDDWEPSDDDESEDDCSDYVTVDKTPWLLFAVV